MISGKRLDFFSRLLLVIMAAGWVMISCSGCVERMITITSQPSGAVVWLNDEEVGSTPVTVPFTWYGKYDVVARKDGYHALHTWREAKAPIYQWPGVDLLAECLWPFKISDKHQWQLKLHPSSEADLPILIKNAKKLRQQAVDNQPQ